MLKYFATLLLVTVIGASVCMSEPNQVLLATGPPPPDKPVSTRVLIVGGGPESKTNQIAIESNVRYILRLLPKSDPRRVLFASGRSADRNVSYEDANGDTQFRASMIPKIDGPSSFDSVKKGLQWVRSDPSASEFIVFTGHGSYDRTGYYRDNWYDLWNDEEFHVTDLAAELDRAPVNVPIVLVMTECYSGGFMNAYFGGGDPDGKPVRQDFCGFFATIPSWMSAGCTPDINEKDYKDFAGYFFAALTGIDRFGHRASFADYNHDGTIGMDEAYDYTLGHDESIDTPTCTSDIFLRRFIPSDDTELFKTPYSDVLSWATPGQRDALTTLSASLNLDGELRLEAAYRKFNEVALTQVDDPTPAGAKCIRFVRLVKSVILAHRLTTGSNVELKSRFAALHLSESRNPLR